MSSGVTNLETFKMNMTADSARVASSAARFRLTWNVSIATAGYEINVQEVAAAMLARYLPPPPRTNSSPQAEEA